MADHSTVARPYAKALFETALAAKNLEGWSRALAAAAAVVGDDQAREHLSRPELGVDERSEFVGSLAAALPGSGLLESTEGKNLLKLLAENHRLGALGEISARFDALKAERQNTVRATLVAASDVDAEQADNVARALSRKLGRLVDLEVEVDETLMGGAIVRAEDMVIDDSVRTRLERLAGSLVD
jgi:F-type H+-transporting ATPase subunit delta